jgi:hypothetical protein
MRSEVGMANIFMTIESGSVITVKGDPEQESGLVKVLYEGQIVKVYMRDIEIRAAVASA